MPITFDTLDELKAFYRTFRLEEATGNGQAKRYAVPTLMVQAPRKQVKTGKRGRPAIAKRQDADAPKKRGPKPKLGALPKVAKPKREKSDTLTFKIQAAIRQFLEANQSFIANDVYAELAKKDAGVNKQSVITSVLKQMNTTFKQVSVTERPGNGPRPVKLYNA